MKQLKEHIKNKTFKKVYLLYGEEEYLIKQYLETMINKLIPTQMQIMNVTKYDGKTSDVNKIIADVETAPFMSQYRVVVVSDSLLFDKGRKEDSEKITSILANNPESTVLIFTEKKADMRTKIFKEVKKVGYCADFKTPIENELIAWLTKYFADRGKIIKGYDSGYFISIAYDNMQYIITEAEKLIDYLGDRNEIERKDIDLIVTKSIEAEMFGLMDAIGTKNCDKALEIFHNFMVMKEHPLMILTMLARQFRLILQCKTLEYQKKSVSEIEAILSIKSFAVKKYLIQGNNFNKTILTNALQDCLEADVNIKTGKIDSELAVEVLIMKYCS